MTIDVPFLGMVGTGKHATDQQPDNYLEEILFLDPNGTAPTLAMLSRIRKTSAETSGVLQHYVQSMGEQGGTFAGLFTASTLAGGVAYAGGGVAGQTLYAQVTNVAPAGAGHSFSHLAMVGEFRVGQRVVFTMQDDDLLRVHARVSGTHVAGAASYVSVILMEPDTVTARTHDLQDVTWIHVIGDANPEGGYAVNPINYVPTPVTNHTQIFKTSWKVTGSDLATALITQGGKTKAERIKSEKQEKRLAHAFKMEKTLFEGHYGYRTSGDGELEWTTMGAMEFVRTYASANIDNYKYNATYSGDQWEESGETWLNAALMNNFRYKARGQVTPMDRLAYTGPEGLEAINRLARAAGQAKLETTQNTWGFKIYNWRTAHGEIHIMTHPWFNQNPGLNRCLFVFHPSLVRYCPLVGRDTFHEDTTPVGYDGMMGQYTTEMGYRFAHAPMWSVLWGLGQTNTA